MRYRVPGRRLSRGGVDRNFVQPTASAMASCRLPCGGVDRNPLRLREAAREVRSPPVRRRGLKRGVDHHASLEPESPPVRRRGLKLDLWHDDEHGVGSPPVRRRGSKLPGIAAKAGDELVASHAEAWIETRSASCPGRDPAGRLSHGGTARRAAPIGPKGPATDRPALAMSSAAAGGALWPPLPLGARSSLRAPRRLGLTRRCTCTSRPAPRCGTAAGRSARR